MAEGPKDAVTVLYDALASGNAAAAISAVEQARDTIVQGDLFDSLFAPAVAMLGGAWASGELDEYAFARASVAADQVASFVTGPAVASDSGLTIVIGTMRGDGHTVAKTIVASALRQAGHRLVDLGSSVAATEFAERAQDSGARIVIACAEQLASACTLRHVRDALDAVGLKDVALLACGGPFAADSGLARAAGARGVVRSAERALAVVDQVAGSGVPGAEHGRANGGEG